MIAVKIYTKTGDKGQTKLVNGVSVHKSDLRLECYGTVDELNSVIGVVCSSLDNNILQTRLIKIQHELFNLGSQLACSDAKISAQLPRVETQCVQRLEKEMDEMTAPLPELRAFILPGGTLPASHLHVARTVCRRAERHTAELIAAVDADQILNESLIYLNRLSDWLFVAARWINHQNGVADQVWQKS